MGDDEAYERAFDEFRKALEAGRDPDVRTFWHSYDGPADRRHKLLLELVEQEIYFRICKAHKPVWVPEYREENPELRAEDLHELLAQAQDYERRILVPTLAGSAETDGPSDAGHPNVPGFRNWKLLAHGAMGVVWQAERLDLPSVTEAFKVPHAQVLKLVGRVALLNEARAAVRVRHPNVCRIYEVCETWPYIRMEYVPGKTLEAWIQDARPPLQILAAKMAGVARAVHAIHKAGIIHRDLKPANVLVEDSEEARPVVIDFGLAKHLLQARTLQAHYGLRGTAAFMAPEQVPPEVLAGQRGPVSERTDVYALGAMLYTLAAGRPPFMARAEEVLRQVVQQEPVFPPEQCRSLSLDFRAICLKALAKDSAKRYASAEEMGVDLERLAAKAPLVYARPPGPFRRLGMWVRKNRVALVAACAMAVLGILLWAYGNRLWHDHQRAILTGELDARLARDALSDGDKDRVEELLQGLNARDLRAAADYREKYIDRLLHTDQPLPLSLDDLARLEHTLVRMSARGAARPAALHQPDRWEHFKARAAPYTHSGSLYFFIRPDPNRLSVLEQVVGIQQLLFPNGASPGAEAELLKAYLAAGDLAGATRVATTLLDRDNLSPAWRITILRDYVWLAIQLAIQSEDQAHLREALERVDAALLDGSAYRPEYLSLLVERARLLAARQLLNEARRDLDAYFDHAKRGDLGLQFDEPKTRDPLLGEGPADNVPVLSFLDACLLRGFLREQEDDRDGAQQAWATGFEKVRRKRVGGYYEAAVLASLSGRLQADDALTMLAYTSSSAGAQGDSPVIKEIRREIRRSPLSALSSALSGVGIVTTVLQRAWQSERGRDYARRIAFRQISFAEFTNVQVRLWLFESLRLAVAGRQGQAGMLSARQDDLVWRLTQDAYAAYARGALSEERFVELVMLGVGRRPVTDWPALAAGLGRLRGPVAYVLSRQFRFNLGRPDDARSFFQEAWKEASEGPFDSPLRALVQAEREAAGR